MSKKRRYIVGVIVVCVVLAWGVVAMLPPSPGVTKTSFDRIEKGMTLEQVESILGKEQRQRGMSLCRDNGFHVDQFWIADDGSIAVISFDYKNEVAYSNWRESPETFSDKLHRWLRLPK